MSDKPLALNDEAGPIFAVTINCVQIRLKKWRGPTRLKSDSAGQWIRSINQFMEFIGQSL